MIQYIRYFVGNMRRWQVIILLCSVTIPSRQFEHDVFAFPEIKEYVVEDNDDSPISDYTKQSVCFASLECRNLAKGIYFESRGESIEGKRAVGFVILERVKRERWGDTIVDVLNEHKQFSYMSDGSINQGIKNEKAFEECLVVAYNVSHSLVENPVEDAVYYLNKHKVKHLPEWANKKHFVKRIGQHWFYREED